MGAMDDVLTTDSAGAVVANLVGIKHLELFYFEAEDGWEVTVLSSPALKGTCEMPINISFPLTDWNILRINFAQPNTC